MRSTFRPLSLSDFEISPEQGFLPQDPREEVTDCAPLNELGHALPKLLSARMTLTRNKNEATVLSDHPIDAR